MIRRALFVVVGLTGTLVACRGGAKVPSEGAEQSPNGQAPKDEIVLSPAEQTSGNIETQPAAVISASEVLRVSGRIARADDRIWRVGVRTEGLVDAIQANLGDTVRKGDVLGRYHADEVREQRAKYRTALSELHRLEAATAQAQRNADRVQTLLTLKAASTMQVEAARQDVVAALTALKNAEIEVERGKDVLEDDLKVPADPQSGAEEADLVPILAPATGYILEKNVTPGRTIAPGTDAFVIGDLSQVWMLASIRQDVLSQLHLGEAATVTLPGLDDQRFVGAITNLGQELDPVTRVMAVRILLNNPEHRLRPEMLANAEIAVGRAKASLVVPSDAVQQVNGQDVVFVRTAPDRFVLRPVRIGPTANGMTSVLEGVTAGEQVVGRGSFVLKSHLLRSTIQGD